MAEKENYSSAPERKLYSEPKKETPSLCGETFSTTPDRKELIAPPSATKAATDPATSYAKRIRLLMSCGLIAGMTPTSTRKRSAQQTLDFAFSPLDGCDAGGQKEDS